MKTKIFLAGKGYSYRILGLLPLCLDFLHGRKPTCTTQRGKRRNFQSSLSFLRGWSANLETCWNVLLLPTYSPDLTSLDSSFWTGEKSFRWQKILKQWGRKCWAKHWNYQPNPFIQSGIKPISKRWRKCIEVRGVHVEKCHKCCE